MKASVKMGNLVRVLLIIAVMNGLRLMEAEGLSMEYYLMSCPFVEPVVKNFVNRALQDDPTLAAPLLRMHFHDCFIQVLSL